MTLNSETNVLKGYLAHSCVQWSLLTVPWFYYETVRDTPDVRSNVCPKVIIVPTEVRAELFVMRTITDFLLYDS